MPSNGVTVTAVSQLNISDIMMTVNNERVLAGGVLRGADGGKCEHGNNRCAEQWHCSLIHDFHGGLAPVHAPLESYEHAVHDHDRIIDQHAERDDESPERYSLEIDIGHAHEDETAANRYEKNESDEQAAAQTHEEQKHDDHDSDSLQQADNETGNRRLHGVRLHCNDAEFHAERDFGSQFRQALLQLDAHRDNVAAGYCRYADADRWLAVETQQVTRWLEEAAFDGGDIAEIDLRIAGRSGNQNRAEILFRFDHGAGFDRDELGADVDAARIGHQVLSLQFLRDGRRRNPELRHAIAVELNVDDLGPVADDVDLGDVLHEQQFPPQHFGDFP